MKIFEWNGRDDIDIVSGASLTNSNVEYKRTEKGMAGLFNGSTSGINVGVKDNTGNKTFIGWVNAKSLGENNAGHIYSDLDYNNIYLVANKLKISRNGSTTAESADISLNKWIFFVITSTDNGVSNIYIDNSLSGSADQSAGSPQLSSTATFIGNRSGSDRTFDGYIGKIFVYDEILNSNQRTKLYKDFLNAPILAETKYWNGLESIRKPNTLNDNGLVSAYNMTPSSNGVLTDIAGSNNGTINGAISTLNGMKFDGVDDYVSAASQITSFPFSQSFRAKVGDTSNTQAFLSNCVTGISYKYFGVYMSASGELIASRRNTTIQNTSLSSGYVEGDILNCTIVYDNATSIRAFVNGMKVYESSSEVSVSIDSAFDALGIGTLRLASPTSFFAGEIMDVRNHNRAITFEEHKAYHNSFNHPYYTEKLLYEGDGQKALGHIPGTGTYEIQTQERPLFRSTDVLENTSAGASYVASTEVNQWEFSFKKQETTRINYQIMSDGTTVAQNGYMFSLLTNEVINFFEYSSGTPTLLSSFGGISLGVDTWYRIKITRDNSGNFEVFIKGGSYGSDYVSITTFTDTTHTTNSYIIIDADVGDLYADNMAGTTYIPVSSFTDGTGTTQVLNNYTLLGDGDISKKYVCSSDGTEAWQSKHAYWTREFEVEKGADANQLSIPFLASTNLGDDDALGYRFAFSVVERISLRKINGGSGANLFQTANSYIKNNTRYGIKIERLKSSGTFRDIDTLQVSDCENSSTAPYTAFSNATRYGFSAISDGSGTHQCATAEEISIVNTVSYLVEFDLTLNSGSLPDNVFLRTDIDGASRSNIESPVEGRNSHILTATGTITGVVGFRSISTAGDYTVSGLRISRIYNSSTFAAFIRGWEFWDSYQLIDVSWWSWDNPALDWTYTESEFSVLDFDSWDSIKNIRYSSQVEQ